MISLDNISTPSERNLVQRKRMAATATNIELAEGLASPGSDGADRPGYQPGPRFWGGFPKCRANSEICWM